MSEDRLRETLSRAAGSEPPSGDAFGRFEHKRAFATRMRAATAIVAGLAAAVTLWFTLPGLGGSGSPGVIGTSGGKNPPGPPRHYRTYTDTAAKYVISIPAEWGGQAQTGRVAAFFPLKSGEQEDNVFFTSSTGDAPSIESPNRFYIQVRALDVSCRARAAGATPRCDHPEGIEGEIASEQRAGGVDVTSKKLTIQGHAATMYELTYKTDAPTEVTAHPRDWCARCVVGEYLVQWPGRWVLDIKVVAPDRQTYDDARDDWMYVVNNIAVPLPQQYRLGGD